MNSDAETTSDKVTSSPPSTSDTSDTHASLDIQSLIKQITNRNERELTILAVVGGLIVVRLLLPQLSIVHVLIGTLGMGVGGFGVAFYLLSVPEHTRVKRASAIAKLGTHGHEYLDSLLPDPVKSTEVLWCDNNGNINSWSILLRQNNHIFTLLLCPDYCSPKQNLHMVSI